ncbi:hypothetical protein SAMN05216571_104283 [Onishia taeanensis]|uniref:Uncharacterized protein n=1 Tax=Onishia taeanensis TaxID=284577 RepID=A0A1G7RIA5_9GAMM|nr:hypothetical protein [Halomonas taeanensis]SDG10517.1 hypothetical protein SAMN05216571_104283 [Halomonas taeanensis]
MTFCSQSFFLAFKKSLDQTRNLLIEGKAYNAIDTERVFRAVDLACKAQSGYFPLRGKAFWNGKAGREFLCDYTFHNEHGRVLLALESEWGTMASPKQTVEKVLYDFRKVVNMAAPIKIMVFAYTDTSNERVCLETMRRLILHWPSEAIGTLLAISCPWHDEMYSESVRGYSWDKGGRASI